MKTNASTLCYDADGNTTAHPANTYAWDSNGRPVTIDGVGLTYDALGRMVEQNRSGVYTQIVYGPNGDKFALMSGSTLQKAIVPLPGGAQALYNSSGLLYYGHSDHLGSIRLGSSSTRSVVFDMAYAPFGETYATSGSTDPAFTSQRQDTVANIYDFPAREYNNFGRWASPDPSGLSAVHPRNPQTLNRYAYVTNSPLAAVDPQGLDGGSDGCRRRRRLWQRLRGRPSVGCSVSRLLRRAFARLRRRLQWKWQQRRGHGLRFR